MNYEKILAPKIKRNEITFKLANHSMPDGYKPTSKIIAKTNLGIKTPNR